MLCLRFFCCIRRAEVLRRAGKLPDRPTAHSLHVLPNTVFISGIIPCPVTRYNVFPFFFPPRSEREYISLSALWKKWEGMAGVDKGGTTVFWADRLSAPMNRSFFNTSFWSIEIIPHGFGSLSQKHATFVIGWCTIRCPVVSLARRASKTIVCPTLNEVDYSSYPIA